MKYNNPNTISFLGVGLWAWPLPMDYDGAMYKLGSCPDKPFNGICFFENTSGEDFSDFAAHVRLGNAFKNFQISRIDQGVKVTIPGAELEDFKTSLASNENMLYNAEELN